MAESNSNVKLELVDVGNRKALVVQVLSKVKGLAMSPEDIVDSTPCTIAENISPTVAEKLQDFLKKAGATAHLVRERAPEDDLFSPDSFPLIEESQEADESFELEVEPSEEADVSFELEVEPSEEAEASFELEVEPSEEADVSFELEVESSEETDESAEEELELSSDEWTFDDSSPVSQELGPEDLVGPSEDFGGFSATTTGSLPDVEEENDSYVEEDEELLQEEEIKEEEKDPGKLQQLFFGGAKAGKRPDEKDVDSLEENVSEESESKKPFKIPFFTKKSTQEIEEGAEPANLMDEENEDAEKKKLSMTLGLLLPAIVGFLIGVVIAGAWGWSTISSVRRKAERDRQQIESRIQDETEQLRTQSQQQAQEINTLNEQNAGLLEQINSLQAQGNSGESPKSIIPSPVPGGGNTPLAEALIASFQELKNVHTRSLEKSFNTQKKAACSQQVLLDGEGTLTYAQIVKRFTVKYTTVDIMQSDSLLTPYIAELKIPFQQEIRTGKTAQACNAAKLQQLPSPKHHEFGTYYGYWTIQYVYKDGKWQVKPTVIERNRALYEKSFQVGSPDHAKFLIDTKLFPEFK